MRYHVVTLVAADLATGRRAAVAVACGEARYASVKWAGAERIDRRFLTPAEWRAVEQAIAEQLEPGPLPAAGVFSRVLLGEQAARHTLQYLWQEPLERDVLTVEELDARLTI